MNKKFYILISMLVFGLTLTASAQSDLRIKQKSRINMPGMSEMLGSMKNPQTGETMDPTKLPDTNILIKGPRMMTESRRETNTPMGVKKMILTTIRQCDLKREVTFTNKSKTYNVSRLKAGGDPSQQTPQVKDPPSGAKRGGTVTFTATYRDTGERQQMLDRTARHVKSTITSKPSPDACDKTALKIEIDAWYIDLPTFSCPTFNVPQRPDMNANGKMGCSDEVLFEVNGKPDNGFAVKETQTITAGEMSFSIVNEVTEIKSSDLDVALFEIPQGYKESKESVLEAKEDTSTNANAGETTQTSDTQMPPLVATDAPVPPKKAGMIRIGIAKPVMKLPDTKNDYSAPLQLSAAVRDSLVEGLKAETVEAIRLSSDAPVSEAREMQCDYIFYANVTQKRGGGGMFGKMILMGAVSMAGAMVPGVGGMVAGTIASQVMGQTMAKAAKAKDEFTFDYKVMDMNNAVLSQAVTKEKVKQDGEDVLTPQLKQASTSVLTAIAAKQ
ncbi:MAG: hypothetical protein ACRD6X_11780 [Pyrinomonadaceae bacterium]